MKGRLKLHTIAAISKLEKQGKQMNITLSGLPQYSFKLPDDKEAKFNLLYTVDTNNKISIEVRPRTDVFVVSADLEILVTELYFKRAVAEFVIDNLNKITGICFRDTK